MTAAWRGARGSLGGGEELAGGAEQWKVGVGVIPESEKGIQ